MASVKLTLSMPNEEAVAEAKRLARERNTSVSAMFLNYIAALAKADEPDESALANLSPNTRRALGLASHLPQDKSYRELLEEALMEKYGTEK